MLVLLAADGGGGSGVKIIVKTQIDR
jgi:hypothetical protein